MTDGSKTFGSQRVLFGLTNGGLFIAGIGSLGVGTWCAIRGESANAVTSLTAGLVLLFAATIDRFELLKGLGIEVKTPQLNEKIQRADQALRKLRQLAKNAEAALVEPRKLFALAEQVRTALQALGSESQTVNQALCPIVLTICRDLAFGFSRPLRFLIDKNIGELKARRSSMRAEDPQLSKLESEIESGNAYLARMEKIYALQLNEFQKGFISLFDDFPYQTLPEFPLLRERAANFFSDIAVLAETMKLANPETWMRELEQARDREAAGEL